MNERIKRLREQSVSTPPALSLERARLYTEAYHLHEGTVSVPELRALAFKHYMAHRELALEEGELIVGEKGPALQSAPTFPELCCHTVEDLTIMDRREKIAFKVSYDDMQSQETQIIPYWRERALRDKMLARLPESWHRCYEAGLFTEFMEQRAPGHTVADGRLYKLGLNWYLEQIDASIEAHAGEPERIAELKGMRIAIEGLYIYADRYRELLAKEAARHPDPVRREELTRMAEDLKVIPRSKPQTFQQALQLYWLVHIAVTSDLNNWDAYSPGRLDQHLAPFYADISREKAKELLECFWIKFNNQPAPPKVGVTLKESGTYTDFANLNTGGLNEEGEDGVNPVSMLILDVMDEMRLTQPSSNVQISAKSPDAFVRRAAEISRKGWGQPAFYNSEAIIRELTLAGKSMEDAYQSGASGCVETGAFGKEAYILTGYLNLPKIMELTLFEGRDPVTGQPLGLPITPGEDFESFYTAYEQQLRHIIEIKIAGNEIIEALYAKEMPSLWLSILTEGCIESGKDYNAGGAKYNTRYLQGVGIGTLTDAMVSIGYNVYEKKHFTLEEMREALRGDFKATPELHHRVSRLTPKYGNDDDRADRMMVRLFNSFHDAVTGRESVCGFTYRINMLPTTCHIYFGQVLGASPDGRRAGLPVSEGISPSKGADVNGPTAVAKSAAKMPHHRTGGTLLNQRFIPQAIAGEKGLEAFSAFIRGYFSLGGHHIQFNVVDTETLRAAQKAPQDHRDLIVRVAGYSDYFNNLDEVLQEEIIQRTAQSMR